LEKIILIAAKLPSVGVKYLADNTGVNINSLYHFTAGISHLSAKNKDIILNYLISCRPDALEAAITLYNGGNYND